jgi:hypothetical protein
MENSEFMAMMNRWSCKWVCAAVCSLGLMSTGALAQPAPTTQVLFENVRVFDGKADALSAPQNVLVRGNKIENISGAPIAVDRSDNTTVVAGGGRTLMPGLIDAHWHAMNAAVPLAVAFNSDPACLNLLAGKEAQNTLLRGFTSVRGAELQPEEGHRRRRGQRPAHLALGRDDFAAQRAWRLPQAHRAAVVAEHAAERGRKAGRQQHCRRRAGGAAARASS